VISVTMELFSAFPHESGIVMQRGIELGMIFSSSLLAHCLFILLGHDRTASSHPAMDMFMECALLLRVICAIPRPYIWLGTWRRFTDARAQPTPELVSRALIGIHSSQNKLEKLLLHFYYAWLLVMSLVALFNPYRTEFGKSVWHHLLLNYACIVLHRMTCIGIFYYLVNSDMARGLHPAVLEKETRVSVCTQGEGECSICYGDYEEGQFLRSLSCGHQYHKQCVDEWLTRHKNRCPMCLKAVGVQ
jgi:hypothetical protein